MLVTDIPLRCDKCCIFFVNSTGYQKHQGRKKCHDLKKKFIAEHEQKLKDIDSSKKRKRMQKDDIDPIQAPAFDYKCFNCNIYFDATTAEIYKGVTGLGCTECASIFTIIEEEFKGRDLEVEKDKLKRGRKKKEISAPVMNKKEGLRSKELVPEEPRNQSCIPYKKLNITTYEQFITPSQRALVDRLKLILKYDC